MDKLILLVTLLTSMINSAFPNEKSSLNYNQVCHELSESENILKIIPKSVSNEELTFFHIEAMYRSVFWSRRQLEREREENDNDDLANYHYILEKLQWQYGTVRHAVVQYQGDGEVATRKEFGDTSLSSIAINIDEMLQFNSFFEQEINKAFNTLDYLKNNLEMAQILFCGTAK